MNDQISGDVKAKRALLEAKLNLRKASSPPKNSAVTPPRIVPKPVPQSTSPMDGRGVPRNTTISSQIEESGKVNVKAQAAFLKTKLHFLASPQTTGGPTGGRISPRATPSKPTQNRTVPNPTPQAIQSSSDMKSKKATLESKLNFRRPPPPAQKPQVVKPAADHSVTPETIPRKEVLNSSPPVSTQSSFDMASKKASLASKLKFRPPQSASVEQSDGENASVARSLTPPKPNVALNEPKRPLPESDTLDKRPERTKRPTPEKLSPRPVPVVNNIRELKHSPPRQSVSPYRPIPLQSNTQTSTMQPQQKSVAAQSAFLPKQPNLEEESKVGERIRTNESPKEQADMKYIRSYPIAKYKTSPFPTTPTMTDSEMSYVRSYSISKHSQAPMNPLPMKRHKKVLLQERHTWGYGFPPPSTDDKKAKKGKEEYTRQIANTKTTKSKSKKRGGCIVM